MNAVGILSGIVILCIGIFFAQKNGTTLGDHDEEDVPTPTITLTPTDTLTPTPTKIPHTPTTKPTNTPVPTSPPTTDTSLSSFHYPGATVTATSSSKLELTSTDGSDTITNWYKDKITSLGMNTKSFVTTSTNGNVLNKLVAADGNKEIRVDITKSSDNATTTIIIIFGS